MTLEVQGQQKIYVEIIYQEIEVSVYSISKATKKIFYKACQFGSKSYL
jgi:hypothetical protein